MAAAPNFGEVVTFLEDLTKREEVTRLGLKLGLSMRRLRRMRLFPEDMIEAWLRGDDEVDNPCWESLAMALEEVGHIGIASSIKKSKVTAKENSSPSNSSETAHMRSYLNPRPLSPELPPRRARGRGLGSCREENFPCLKSGDLSQDERNRLKGRLVVESKGMRDRYATLLVQTDRSLNRRNVSIQSLHAFLQPYNIPDLNESDDEVSKILLKALDLCWFFSCAVLKDIIKNFGTSVDKERLVEYEEAFGLYGKRRFSEIPMDAVNNSDRKEGSKIYVKVDKNFDVPAGEVFNIETEISDILGKPVYLNGVENECIKLTYYILHELDEVFPLNEEQKERLRGIGVLRIYGEHNEYFTVSKGAESLAPVEAPPTGDLLPSSPKKPKSSSPPALGEEPVTDKITPEKAVEVFTSHTTLNIMVVGRSGIGKSSLVNGIIGKVAAEVSELGAVEVEGVTEMIQQFKAEEASVTITFWDTPGLLDQSGDPQIVLGEIKKKVANVDLVFYCIDMTRPRFSKGSEEKKAMQRFTETVGADVWNKAVIVLTKANAVIGSLADTTNNDNKKIQEGYKQNLSDWIKMLQDGLRPVTEFVDQLPIVPAGISTKPIIDVTSQEYWLSVLWEQAYKRIKRSEGQVSLVKMNLPRLRDEVEMCDFEDKDLYEQPIKIEPSFTKDLQVSMQGIVTVQAAADIGEAISSVYPVASTLNRVTLGIISAAFKYS